MKLIDAKELEQSAYEMLVHAHTPGQQIIANTVKEMIDNAVSVEPKNLVKKWHKNPLGDYTRIYCPWCGRELYETGTLKDSKACPFCVKPIRYTNTSMVVT